MRSVESEERRRRRRGFETGVYHATGHWDSVETTDDLQHAARCFSYVARKTLGQCAPDRSTAHQQSEAEAEPRQQRALVVTRLAAGRAIAPSDEPRPMNASGRPEGSPAHALWRPTTPRRSLASKVRVYAGELRPQEFLLVSGSSEGGNAG